MQTKDSISKIPACSLLFSFKRNNGLPLLFILLIFLPLGDMLLQISRPIPIMEKRQMAAIPRFDSLHLRDFTGKFEAYFNDHFGLRTQLLYVHNLIMVKYFHTSPTPKVTLGRRGWLFMAKETENRSVTDSFRVLNPFSEAELLNWRRALKQRWTWLKERGIVYLFIIVPNKSSIYPEHMPAAIKRLHPQSRMDQLLAALRQENGFPVVDIKETLLAAKASQRLYHKTDSHWNDLGAYFAYRKIMERLAADFPGLKFAALNEFSMQSRDRMGGDLALMLALQKKYFREQFITLKPLFPVSTRSAGKMRRIGKFARKSISESTGGTLPAALMVHDSFIHQLRPLLNPHFRRITYIWDARLIFYPELIRKENPKIVIEEMTERKLEDLQLRNPDSLAAAGQK